MSTFNVPTREEVSENNQAIFDNLNKALGFVPNIYAGMAHSKTALGDFLQFSNAKTSLTGKEKEEVDEGRREGRRVSGAHWDGTAERSGLIPALALRHVSSYTMGRAVPSTV